MTTRSVRIPAELDAAVGRIAASEHISINTAIVHALEAWAETHEHRARVRAMTAQIMTEDAALLHRLSDA